MYKKYPRIEIHVKTNDPWFNLSQYLRYSGFTRIDDQKSTGLSGMRNFDKSAEGRLTDKKII